MTRLIISVSVLLASMQAHAQITGQAIDDKGLEVPFANVLVLNPSDSSMVKGGLTDMQGKFDLDNVPFGEYMLYVNLISYEKWYSPVFRLDAQNPSKEFGAVNLKEETKLLDGVQVTAERMQVEQTVEGTVVNVQSSMAAKGSTALEILERSPGVVLDRRYNNLTLNGQSGTLVMINGRPIRMSPAEIINMLNGMSADNLESVELLTNPSAKYDADGGAGIINLKIKKSEDQGTNGSLSLTSGYGWGPKQNVALNLNHRREKVNYYGSYSYNYDDTFVNFNAIGQSTNEEIIGGTQTFDFTGNPSRINHSHNTQAGFELEATDKLTLGLNTLYNYNTSDADIYNDANYYLPDNSFMHADIFVSGLAPTHNLSSTLFLENRFSHSATLNVDFDYIYYNTQSPTQVNSSYSGPNGEPVVPSIELFVEGNRGESETSLNVGVFKVDYSQSIGERINLELGVKGAISKTENNAYIDQLINGTWQRDVRNVNDQVIDEQIGAAYTSVRYSMDSLTTLTGGLRYEYWDRRFSDTDNRNAGRLFPSAFLTRKLPNNKSLQAAYNRRITRPGYNDLSTYLRYNTTFSVFTGNSTLRPAITDNFKVGLQFGAYNISAIYTYEAQPLARFQVATNDTEDLILISPQNLVYQQTFGVQFHAPFDITKWWAITVGGTLSSRMFEVDHTPITVDKQYFTANLYGNQNFSFKNNFSIELSGFYNASHYNGSVKNDGFGMLNFGAKKEFGNNSSLQFTVTDVLQTMKINFLYGGLTPDVWDNQADGTYRAESAHARIFKLTYFKSFGSNKIKGARNKNRGSKEERNRIGS